MTDAPAWQAAVVAAVGGGKVRWSAGGGSALNATWRLDAGGASYFVKVNGAARSAMLDAEADGLRALAATGAVRVPAPVAAGVTGDVAWLALEWLAFGRGPRGGHGAALGRALAALHRTTAPRFGWHRDNTIGTTPQANGWADDWAAFFRDRRLAPQLALAARRGAGRALAKDGERLLAAVPALLAGHRPAASLLHGDLWGGNAACLATGEPVVFDPAVYHGDREADLAMTELFGGFGADFHAAYREAWPLPAGYAVRRTLYNLYHVLNHFNLFGGGYGAEAAATMGRLLAEVR